MNALSRQHYLNAPAYLEAKDLSLGWENFCRLSSKPDVLNHVHEQGVQAAIWRRELSAQIHSLMSSLHLPMPRQFQCAIDDIDLAESKIRPLVTQFFNRESSARELWLADLLGCIQLAWRLSRKKVLKIRLESVANNACRLFHTDQIAARMLCTYRGDGTMLIPDAAVCRFREQRAENQHVLDVTAIRSMKTGDVACIKGDKYPGQWGNGLFHRSPLAMPNNPRILLAIDIE